jgi:hypothetical protein
VDTSPRQRSMSRHVIDSGDQTFTHDDEAAGLVWPHRARVALACFLDIYFIYLYEHQTMPAASPSLLLKFRRKDTQFGVTRDTVKKMAAMYDLSETEVVHMALSRMAKDDLPAYEADDGPLTARQLNAVRKVAAASLPSGKVLSKQTLF